METTKMTIFFKKRNLEIDKISTGEQTLASYARMDMEDAQLIYDYLILDYDDYIFNNNKNFIIVDTNGIKTLEMKAEYKIELQKYI